MAFPTTKSRCDIGLQISGTAEVLDASSGESGDILNLRQITKEKLEKIGHPIYVIKISPISFEILNASFEEKGFGKRQLLILA